MSANSSTTRPAPTISPRGTQPLPSNARPSTLSAQEDAALPTRSISLTDYFDSFVDQSIRAGRFANASEVVRAGPHLLERREQEWQERRAALQVAAAEGFGALVRGDDVLVEGEAALRLRLREVGRAARAGISSPTA